MAELYQAFDVGELELFPESMTALQHQLSVVGYGDLVVVGKAQVTAAILVCLGPGLADDLGIPWQTFVFLITLGCAASVEVQKADDREVPALTIDNEARVQIEIGAFGVSDTGYSFIPFDNVAVLERESNIPML